MQPGQQVTVAPIFSQAPVAGGEVLEVQDDQKLRIRWSGQPGSQPGTVMPRNSALTGGRPVLLTPVPDAETWTYQLEPVASALAGSASLTLFQPGDRFLFTPLSTVASLAGNPAGDGIFAATTDASADTFDSGDLSVWACTMNGNSIWIDDQGNTGAQDFGDTIAYVNSWVSGSSFDWNRSSHGSSRVVAAAADIPADTGPINNFTRAALIPFFCAVNQVEGLGTVVLGLLDGVKAGLLDDWSMIELIGSGSVEARSWAYDKARAEINDWRNRPLKRAAELKRTVDQICETVVFSSTAVQELGDDLHTWEGLRKRSWETWKAIRGLHQTKWAIEKSVWNSIVDGLIAWADDFCARMMTQS